MGRETKPPTGYLFSVPARLTRSADIPLGKRDACPAIPPVGSPWFLVWHFSLCVGSTALFKARGSGRFFHPCSIQQDLLKLALCLCQ